MARAPIDESRVVLLWQQSARNNPPRTELIEWVRMGAALSCRAEWTSASEKGGKLDFSKTNESLLVEIVKFAETLSRDHPREAQVVFKRPFVWKSSLALSSFDQLKQDEGYSFR